MAKLSVTKPQSMFLSLFHLYNKNMFLAKQLDIMRVLFFFPPSLDWLYLNVQGAAVC